MWFWDNETATSVKTSPQRWSDLYIFAYHPESEERVADHRRPEQWEFYVVAERELNPSRKSIGLGPVRRMEALCRFDALAYEVTRAVAELPQLKADLPLQ